jgi:hypothetical protein
MPTGLLGLIDVRLHRSVRAQTENRCETPRPTRPAVIVVIFYLDALQLPVAWRRRQTSLRR